MRKFLWTLFLLFDGLLVAAFLLGYSAWYVPPARMWWPELMAIILPYLSLAICLVLLAVLVARRWVLVALHAILFLLVVVRFAPAHDVGHFRKAGPDDFRVMTFNLPGPDLLAAAPAEQADALGALVDTEEPDLIGFQEVHLYLSPKKRDPDGHIRIISREKGYTYARPARVTRPLLISQPVAGRIPFGDAEIIYLDHTNLSLEKTYLVRTPFTWKGRRAVHYNVHLQSYHPPQFESENVGRIVPRTWLKRLAGSEQAIIARAEEAEQIHQMITREKVPVVLSGDFNTTPHSWAYHRIAQGMTDAFKSAGSGWGATWHARIPLFRIDFIMVSPEWEVVSAHVPHVSLSDHRPLVARLRWRDWRVGP